MRLVLYNSVQLLGLRYDDLIVEENDIAQEALRRLSLASPREAYDRAYRLRVAQQCSLSHTLLPEEQWTKPEDVCFVVLTRFELFGQVETNQISYYVNRMSDTSNLWSMKLPPNLLSVRPLITLRFCPASRKMYKSHLYI